MATGKSDNQVRTMIGDPRRSAYYLGELVGVPIFVHWTALVLVLMSWDMTGGRSVVDVVLVLVALVLAILLHELGHGLTARAMGATGITITLWALGGLCSSRRDAANRVREICILVAGPLVSLVLWLGCRQAYDLLGYDGKTSLFGRLIGISYVLNKALFFFNILPMFPLDGGQIVYNGLLLGTRNHLLVRQLCLSIAVGGAILFFLLRTGFFSAFGAPDPVGTWMHGLAAQGQSAVFLAVVLSWLVFNAYAYLR